MSEFISPVKYMRTPPAIKKPKHSHYYRDVSDYDTIDVYVICDLYVKDLQEAIDTIQRKIEILQGKERLGVASYDR